MQKPMGILEDVLIKVGSFFIPVDFVVLKMEEDTKPPIILGRPFLATAGAVIDVKKGKLVFNIGDDTIEFDLASSLKKPFIAGSYCSIDTINDEVGKRVELSSSNVDPLQVSLIGGELAEDNNKAKFMG